MDTEIRINQLNYMIDKLQKQQVTSKASTIEAREMGGGGKMARNDTAGTLIYKGERLIEENPVGKGPKIVLSKQDRRAHSKNDTSKKEGHSRSLSRKRPS